jgi:hypothetical protein
VAAILVGGLKCRTPFWKGTTQGSFQQSLVEIGSVGSGDFFKISSPLFSIFSKWFQTRRFLWEFPIGSFVKLSSAVVAILVGVLKCRTQFWKGTTQGSFQQSLVEIGSVVSEKIF